MAGSCSTTSEPGVGSAFCAAEAKFHGVRYRAVDDAEWTANGLPAHPRRGDQIGREKACDDTGSWRDGTPVIEEPVWLTIYEVKGVDPADGIIVERLGPMVPFTDDGGNGSSLER